MNSRYTHLPETPSSQALHGAEPFIKSHNLRASAQREWKRELIRQNAPHRHLNIRQNRLITKPSTGITPYQRIAHEQNTLCFLVSKEKVEGFSGIIQAFGGAHFGACGNQLGDSGGSVAMAGFGEATVELLYLVHGFALFE
ncbi:hypothetical protein C1H46_007297 [Malus baccata]|uniref:Uncharacterized protein n=1 Tax=Malus baccata TaxID=106549 RepID=A0A540N960_MALBA|nr:hypothetical protein C1H46_007297 [Malus baccata]